MTDTTLIGTLSELGVILLFFTIGLEFSVRRIARVGIPTLLTVIIELSLIATVMFGVGRLFGWARVEAIFVALGVSIASTMLVVKGLEEQPIDKSVKELVLAIMVVEDLLSILLLAILTGVASGSGLSPRDLAWTIAKLGGFFVAMIALGMLVVPRAIRHVARLERADALVVSALAVCFGFVWIALRAGYSVALGAFIAGTLIAESGKGQAVDHVVKPFRDAFAAIFFVSIGMTIVPSDVAAQWPAALTVGVVLVIAKTFGISIAGILTGNGLRRSVQAGLTLSQIGELSFIAVAIGISAGPTVARPFLLPVVVGASCLTAISGASQIRHSARIAVLIDHALPKSMTTFLCFYDSWIARLRNVEHPDTLWWRVRSPLLNALVNSALLVTMIIGLALGRSLLTNLASRYGVGERLVLVVVLAVGGALCAVLASGIARHAILLARLLAREVIPLLQPERDLGRAPRNALELAFEATAFLLIGLPVAAITQPFVPGGGLVVALALFVIGLFARRSMSELDQHMRAGAELIVEVLARQAHDAHQDTAGDDPHAPESAGVRQTFQSVLPGLDATPIVLSAGSPSIGRTLAQIDLRAKTGASVLAITRGEQGAANPSPHEPLREHDVLAIAGSDEAVAAARDVLLGPPSDHVTRPAGDQPTPTPAGP